MDNKALSYDIKVLNDDIKDRNLSMSFVVAFRTDKFLSQNEFENATSKDIFTNEKVPRKLMAIQPQVNLFFVA
ncbi:hypothetical protein [Shewanella gelidii]|uniref:hypothetical protein n=1 Tax=Shewanella gelidii TaxID=1642821 RepID=UPI001668E21F|nr:hypothetical protein [Shewanella gelidii]MCL1099197.1 hypothetical protein [Shewanella gelidii]